ncbi:MAG: phosphate ABC transporter permease PstA [bacterium]|nr:phosphate ABC transporter permease PstA [bacterium]
MKLVVKSLKYRRLANRTVQVLSALSASVGLAMLLWILIVVFLRGFKAINLSFFTQLPMPPGMVGGGLANAIAGTLLITVLAALIGTPIGLMAGIYLAEFGKGRKLAAGIRFFTNIMIGVPSIIVGVFVYTLIVLPSKSFSTYAGAAALAIIMLPVVVRTTEDMLTMVPNSLREAGLSLGVPNWRVILGITFRAARSGLITGVLLAVARVSGETAPLLFTALNSPYWINSLHEPVANLTVTIFNYAMSPYADWKQQAWGASLLIMGGVLFLNIFARIAIKTKTRTR